MLTAVELRRGRGRRGRPPLSSSSSVQQLVIPDFRKKRWEELTEEEKLGETLPRNRRSGRPPQ